MLEDASYTLDWNIPMSLSMCDFSNSVLLFNIIGRAWYFFLVEEGANKTGVYWCPNCASSCKLNHFSQSQHAFACSEVCVNLAYTMQRYMGLKVQQTWRIRHSFRSLADLATLAQNHQLDFKKFATAFSTSYVLGQRSSQFLETLQNLMVCLLFVNVSILKCVV